MPCSRRRARTGTCRARPSGGSTARTTSAASRSGTASTTSSSTSAATSATTYAPPAGARGTRRRCSRGALPWARDLGIDPALVTCDEDNIGSVRVIEAAGGVLEDVRGIKRRYWVPTA